jgi:hypothetical protein
LDRINHPKRVASKCRRDLAYARAKAVHRFRAIRFAALRRVSERSKDNGLVY